MTVSTIPWRQQSGWNARRSLQQPFENPANGPTETIGMLACWAADAIKDYVRIPDSLV